MIKTPILASRHFAWITLAYVIFIVYGSLVPLAFRPVPLEKAWERFGRAFSQSVAVSHRSDWLANILLFIPLGFVGMGWLRVDRERGRPLLAIASLLVAFALLSTLIEFVQIWFPPRHTSINDVAAETFGGAIGIGIWLVAGPRITDALRNHWIAQAKNSGTLRLLGGYLLVLVIAHGMPFDLTLSPSVLGRKFREGRVLPIPFTISSSEPLDLLRKGLINFAYFLPAGMLIAGLPGPVAAGRNAGWRVLGIGCCLAGAIEMMQLFIFTRYFDATDIITGSLAVVAGWGLIQLGRSEFDAKHPKEVRQGLLLTWVVVLAFVHWEPFDFVVHGDFLSRRCQEWSFIPFADYYAGNYLLSFSSMIDKTMLFVPFGLFLALASSTRGSWFIVSSALLLAFLLEAGQFFLVWHTPGMSDLFLEPLGAWIGYQVAPRLPFRSPEGEREVIVPQAVNA